MSNRIMLDLEALGTEPGCVIVSIGAVRFDASGVTDTFSVNVDAADCQKHGLTIDACTVAWWMEQGDEARRVFADGERRNLIDALYEFTQWADRPEEVWGNGANFDNAVLCAAYKRMRVIPPWSYSADRCYRTIKNLCRSSVSLDRFGVHHRALDDAISQANHLVACLDFLGLRAAHEGVAGPVDG